MLAIKETGIGITQEVKKRVFELFLRSRRRAEGWVKEFSEKDKG
jgi:signal transduction histidine kinase